MKENLSSSNKGSLEPSYDKTYKIDFEIITSWLYAIL